MDLNLSLSILYPESRAPKGERREGPAPQLLRVSHVCQASAMLWRSRFLGHTRVDQKSRQHGGCGLGMGSREFKRAG